MRFVKEKEIVTNEQLTIFLSIFADTLMAQMLALRDKNFQITIINMLKKLEEKMDKKVNNVNIELESLKKINWTFLIMKKRNMRNEAFIG